MPLFGVRYLSPSGPLIKVDGPIGAAVALSRHANCLTWVVQVDYDDNNQLVQVGHPLHEHNGRLHAFAPELPLRRAPQSRANTYNQERRFRCPRPATMRALLRLADTGEGPAQPDQCRALHRRGWTTKSGWGITAAGRLAVEEYRAKRRAAVVGATS